MMNHLNSLSAEHKEILKSLIWLLSSFCCLHQKNIIRGIFSCVCKVIGVCGKVKGFSGFSFGTLCDWLKTSRHFLHLEVKGVGK